MCVWRIAMMAAASLLVLEAGAQQGLEPVLPEEPNFGKYAAGIQGFTGFNRQQIAYWELKPAMRTRVSGYKGTLVRLANGDFLAHNGVNAFYRSTDEGRTWEKFEAQWPNHEWTQGQLKETRMVCLRDGTLLITSCWAENVYRSTDGGRTWQQHQRPAVQSAQHGTHSLPMYARDVIEQPDGSILAFNSDGAFYIRFDSELPPCKSWRVVSRDGGVTWDEHEEISTWEAPHNPFWEGSVLALSDTHLLATTRVHGDFAFGISGEMPPRGIPTPAGDEVNNRMVLFESEDAGLHWDEPRVILDYSEVHGHLLKLTDGRILCTYANYHLPFGAAAVLSEDNGRTWDNDHPIQLGEAPTCYAGYPTSLQVADGSIVTTWAGGGFNIVRWELPPPGEG